MQASREKLLMGCPWQSSGYESMLPLRECSFDLHARRNSQKKRERERERLPRFLIIRCPGSDDKMQKNQLGSLMLNNESFLNTKESS